MCRDSRLNSGLLAFVVSCSTALAAVQVSLTPAALPSSAAPVGAVTADFDGDGLSDLAALYSGPRGGILVVRAATGDFATGGAASPFGPAALVPVPVSDWLLAGDFDADGFQDVVMGTRGGESLSVLMGDGAGHFPRTSSIALFGRLTALLAADVNRPDGLADILAAVESSGGASLLVFESPAGAVAATPEQIPLAEPAEALAAGFFTGTPFVAVAAASGNELALLNGRDRRLHTPGANSGRPEIERYALDAPLTSLISGRFVPDPSVSRGLQLAGLTADGDLVGMAFGASSDGQRRLAETFRVDTHSRVPILLRVRRWEGDGDGLLLVHPGSLRADLMQWSAQASRLVTAESLPLPPGTSNLFPVRLGDDGLDDLVRVGNAGETDSVLLSPLAATFTVNSTGDTADAAPGNGACNDGTGACTLRAAIQESNALAGADTINFNIGAGTPTIAPLTALPSVTGVVSIQGATGGATRIQLNGAGAGAGANGLTLSAGSGGSLVRALVINRFGGWGIRIESASNTVEACWIGLDSAGSTSVAGNTAGGVLVTGAAATSNLIGGSSTAARNVISHNGANGVQIDTSANGNQVQGNYIGTNAGANIAAGNTGDGIAVAGGAQNTTVGGSPASPGTPPGNVISGNSGDGVDVSGATTTTTLITGNFIGLNGAGTGALGNAQNGVLVQSSSAGNTIGGTAAAQRNVISGNNFATSDGVELNGAGVTGTNVFGNYIGLDVNGTSGISNGANGILVQLGASSNTIGAATATPGLTGGNVLSGNTLNGVDLDGSATTGNLIQGNLIGLRAGGTAAQKNLQNGVLVHGAVGNNVGGSSSTQRNVISGNQVAGINADVTGPINLNIQGNYIGTDITGASAIGNLSYGVRTGTGAFPGTTSVLIGGPTATPGSPPGNVISGNVMAGISMIGPGSPVTVGNNIQGNYIGLNAAGTAAVGNGTGVRIEAHAGTHTIGGAAANLRNIISGNNTAIVFDVGNASSAHVVQGNYIGTNPAGTAAIPNGGGISVGGGGITSPVQIGGVSATPGLPPGNVISGNTGTAVGFSGGNSGTVRGNIIGTTADGMSALPNGSGIGIGQSTSATIGGSGAGEKNLISGNGSSSGSAAVICSICAGGTVRGNWIGTNITGTAAIPNRNGVMMTDGGASRSAPLTVGGSAAGQGNVISGNLDSGVVHDALSGGTIEGNLIGVAPDGVSPMGNGAWGVQLKRSSSPTIGGTTGLTVGSCTGSCNTIRFNTLDGIGSTYTFVSAYVIQGNRISSNGGLGIDNPPVDGVTPNNAPDTTPPNFPVIQSVIFDSGSGTSAIQGSLLSTASTSFTIYVYANPGGADPSGNGEGDVWLGSTTCPTDVSGNGTWSLTVSGNPQNVTAVSFGTLSSEFSAVFVDSDGDGYGNSFDNCPTIPNPDQIDGDFDGLGAACDCNDGDAGAFAFPAEVTGVQFAANETTLSWTSVVAAAGPSTVHDVLRGAAAALPVDGGPGESCLISTASSSTTDSGVPPTGVSWWYVVRGRNSCGSSTYGFASSGTERTSGACP